MGVVVRPRRQSATRAPPTASVIERGRVLDDMPAANGRAIGASERAALLGTDANTQRRATDGGGDEEAWERAREEAPRRSFGARVAVVTVATLACGAFAAIAGMHATGGEVSLFASALGSKHSERLERLEARQERLDAAEKAGEIAEAAEELDRLSHGNARERRQAKRIKRQAARASKGVSEAAEATNEDASTDEVKTADVHEQAKDDNEDDNSPLIGAALGSKRSQRRERFEAENERLEAEQKAKEAAEELDRLSHGNARERRQAKRIKRQAARASEDSEDSSEKGEEENKDDGATEESAEEDNEESAEEDNKESAEEDNDDDAKKSGDDTEDQNYPASLGMGTVAGAAPTRRNNENGIPRQPQQAELGLLNVDVSKVPKTYIIADTEPSKDKDRAQVAYDYIVNSFMKYAGLSEEEAKKTTTFSEAVYPTRWPKTLNAARDAVAGMMDREKPGFPAIDVKAALADGNNRCVTGPCQPSLNHHLGCALSHLAVWKKGLDSGAEAFVTWESDGMGIHAIHPLDYAELARQVPKDADMIWLVDLAHRGSGQFVKKFKSQSAGKWAERTHGGDMTTLTSNLGESTVKVNQTGNVYIHKFNKICGWAGAGAIMWTRSGAQRLRDHVNEHGAGMIDAWLAGQCINHKPGGFNLNCYAAHSRPVLKEHVGGYLPDWYYDESRTGEMPQHMIDEMDANVDKYNRFGCQRGGDEYRKQAFAPMGWPDAQGDEFDRTVKSCVAPHGSIDPCNEHYPRGRREVEDMRQKVKAEEKKNNRAKIASLASTEISTEDRKLLFDDPEALLPVQLSTS